MSVFLEWAYHPVHGARLFTSQKALKDAGPGWCDSPAKFGAEIEIKTETTPRTIDTEAPSPVSVIASTPSKPIEEFVAEAASAEPVKAKKDEPLIPPSVEQSIAQKAKELRKR
jgi:hypothetical protein